jgi:hypothetical protein
VEFEDGEQFLTYPDWYSWIGIFLVEENSLLETVQIRCAIWAAFEMTHDRAAGPRSKLGIELKLQMGRHLAAPGGMFMTLMHRVSWPSSEERDRIPFATSPNKSGPLILNSGHCCADVFFVENLKRRYRGQKLTALVTRKMTAKRPRTAATVPDIAPVK